MKVHILITGIILLLFASCDNTPYADFVASDVEADEGEFIYFTNRSQDADYYEWDFGDGTYSNAVNPSHAYNYYGIYTVSLTVFRNGRAYDEAYLQIEILYPTTLEITVVEYYDEYTVSDASIILYPSLYDWDEQTNPLVEGITNSQGVVTFSRLNPRSYYVDVWHYNHDNYALRNEDVDWIRTEPLEENALNYFIAWVDYVPSKSRTDAREKGKYKILKIERIKKDYTGIQALNNK
ncbi:MAG: PKD domain-containing protein [Bacteroidales bacterium]|nr:PKD domain-containing protein [Bacteroidales bacterium]